MLPINFINIIKKNASDHTNIFTEVLLKRIELEDNSLSYPVINQCSASSLQSAIKVVLNTVPQSYINYTSSFMELSVRRHPMDQTLEIFPLFSPVGILTLLVKEGILRSFRLNTISSTDTFEMNGIDSPVLHQTSKDQGANAGAYLEITLSDGITNVWTITPEELEAAGEIWDKNIFGHVKVLNNRNDLFTWCVFLRACKTMTCMLGFSPNNGIGELIANISHLYNQYFVQFKDFQKDRFAISVKNNNRNIVDQPSELEESLKKLPEISKNPVLRVKESKNSITIIPQSNVTNAGKLLNFGIGGW